MKEATTEEGIAMAVHLVGIGKDGVHGGGAMRNDCNELYDGLQQGDRGTLP